MWKRILELIEIGWMENVCWTISRLRIALIDSYTFQISPLTSFINSIISDLGSLLINPNFSL